MQTKNVVAAVRSRLGAVPDGGAPTGAVAPKRRPRRLIALALAAALAAVPISAAVQTVGASKAHAAVDDRYAVARSAAAMAAFTFWRDRAHWPATGPSNAMHYTGNGVINGGGTYNDRDNQLRNWIGHATNNWGPLNFREYDAAARRSPSDPRGQMRYVLNVEYGLVFRTDDHYGNFTLLNFGGLGVPRFPDHVFCYANPMGQPNDRRLVLHNLRWQQVDFGGDIPGSGESVEYHRTWQYWDYRDRTYYVDQRANNYTQGMSFPAMNALAIHNNPSAICWAFAGLAYGTF